MGATVLHEDAVFPVRKAGIPINIRNTNAPEDEGTLIVESTCRMPDYTITGIAGKKGFVAVNIDKDMMNSEVGFGRKVAPGDGSQTIPVVLFLQIPPDGQTLSWCQSQMEDVQKKSHVPQRPPAPCDQIPLRNSSCLCQYLPLQSLSFRVRNDC